MKTIHPILTYCPRCDGYTRWAMGAYEEGVFCCLDCSLSPDGFDDLADEERDRLNAYLKRPNLWGTS